MAFIGVFGDPITNSTLERMPEYQIKRKDRARVALNMKNARAGNKYINAKTYVENLKKEMGDGVSTICLVYNATGDSVRFATSYNWDGIKYMGQSEYPQVIENGQWGGFLHTKNPGLLTPSGSIGAVVYRGKNEGGDECDWMLSWSNPWKTGFLNSDDNKAYTEICEAHHYDNIDWGHIQNLLKESNPHHSGEWNGCLSSDVSIGQGTTVMFEAIMTLKNA